MSKEPRRDLGPFGVLLSGERAGIWIAMSIGLLGSPVNQHNNRRAQQQITIHKAAVALNAGCLLVEYFAKSEVLTNCHVNSETGLRCAVHLPYLRSVETLCQKCTKDTCPNHFCTPCNDAHRDIYSDQNIAGHVAFEDVLS
jgi:hypothetical protein